MFSIGRNKHLIETHKKLGWAVDKNPSYEIIKKIASEIDIDLIVGGGIRTPQMAKSIVESGASHVVIGSAIEKSTAIAKEFSSAIHYN